MSPRSMAETVNSHIVTEQIIDVVIDRRIEVDSTQAAVTVQPGVVTSLVTDADNKLYSH